MNKKRRIIVGMFLIIITMIVSFLVLVKIKDNNLTNVNIPMRRSRLSGVA